MRYIPLSRTQRDAEVMESVVELQKQVFTLKRNVKEIKARIGKVSHDLSFEEKSSVVLYSLMNGMQVSKPIFIETFFRLFEFDKRTKLPNGISNTEEKNI